MSGGAARALLTGVVDYAGLFPPAGLAMPAAVAEYARWRSSAEGWLLGRFVVPAARLSELSQAALPHFPAPGSGAPWRLSALVGADPAADRVQITAFNADHGGWARVDTVELRAASAAEVKAALGALPRRLAAYVELAPGATTTEALPVLAAAGARAKLRAGGLVPSAIPSLEQVAGFILACAGARVPFKATAGLHHALRAERALTYEADSPRAPMHGFLNVFAASALAWQGAPPAQVEAALAEAAPSAFRFEDDALVWRGERLATAALAECRQAFACSFGSCSFEEPLADLRALGVLA